MPARVADRPVRATVMEGRSTADGRPIRLSIEGDRIAAIERLEQSAATDWIGPGWLDVQVNGFAGHDPNATDADPNVTAAMIRSLWQTGLTGACVTICTEAEAHMIRCLAAVRAACEADAMVAESVIGIHVEGPHISPEDGPRGAHPLRHVRPPDVEEYRRWQDAAGGRIRIVTISPEYNEAIPYVAAIVADGVVASIGHTAATTSQIRAAVDAGASWSTHLGNGAHAVITRHPNYIWDQLAEDRLHAGFIFDGQHLPPAVMKSVIRAKQVERSVLVSDAVYVAGLAPGLYALPDGAAVELKESGRLELQGTPYLAGAVDPLSVGIGNAIRHAGVGLADAIRMVTTNPSRLLGLPISAGHDRLRVGATANLTMFRLVDQAVVQPIRTIVGGHVVHDVDAA